MFLIQTPPCPDTGTEPQWYFHVELDEVFPQIKESQDGCTLSISVLQELTNKSNQYCPHSVIKAEIRLRRIEINHFIQDPLEL